MIRRAKPALVSPYIECFASIIGQINSNALFLPIILNQNNYLHAGNLHAMIDSGAGGQFIDQNFAMKQKLRLEELKTPIKVFNVDGTKNKQGKIKYFVHL